jgi:hypothetical protein
MSDLCSLIWCALIGIFRPRAALQAENLVLRHQLNVLRRKSPKRLAFGNVDRLVFTALYRVAPGVLDALKILNPQTVIRWHRAGFQAYWRWKSRARGGRPKTPADHSPAYSRHEHREPALGSVRSHPATQARGGNVARSEIHTTAETSASDPRRTAQAWHRCWANHRGKIHGQ